MFQHEQVVALAIEAGNAILEIYNKGSTIDVMTKDDNSPLTDADLAAHRVIVGGLQQIDPDTPIVSEEGRVGDPLSSDLCWLVDPLDGTKEFVKRNGMFTVNIALMTPHNNRWEPIFGVVHAPVTSTTWSGGKGDAQAERLSPNATTPIKVRPSSGDEPIRLVASGSHRGKGRNLRSLIGEVRSSEDGLLTQGLCGCRRIRRSLSKIRPHFLLGHRSCSCGCFGCGGPCFGS